MDNKLSILYIVLLSLVLHIPTYAAPSKPSVSGTYSHGQTITVSGSGFGTKSPAKPYLWAPFDGSLNPSSLGTKTSWDTIESMAYTSNEGVGGTGGAKATDNSGIWTMAINSSGFNWNDYNQQIYIFRKKKLNFDPGSINWKVWRMWPPSVGSTPDVYVGTNNGCAFTEGIMASCKYFDGFTFNGTTNSWDSEEIIVKSNSSSGAADGILRLNTDGVSAGNITNMQYKNGAGVMTGNYVVHFVKASATLGSSDRVWVDDVYVDTTWARVMLGNASSLSASTRIEPQIPSAWSSTSITATVNTGTFATNETVYLYVVDSDGGVSPASDPITVGESSGGDATAPSTTISTSDPSSISSDILTVTGSASDAVGVSGCKWRIGSAPTSSAGTACTGTTSFSCSTSGYSIGANTLYVGCYDAAGNYGSDSITVNYTPASSTVSLGTVLIGR